MFAAIPSAASILIDDPEGTAAVCVPSPGNLGIAAPLPFGFVLRLVLVSGFDFWVFSFFGGDAVPSKDPGSSSSSPLASAGVRFLVGRPILCQQRPELLHHAEASCLPLLSFLPAFAASFAAFAAACFWEGLRLRGSVLDTTAS